MAILPRNMTIGVNPWRRVFTIFLAILISLWTARGMALTPDPGTLIVNKATVQYVDANGNPLSADSNNVSVPLSGAPRLRLEKIADSDPVAAGSTFNYTLRYENRGNASATGVTVLDTLPVGLTFQSASGGGVYSSVNNTVTWSLGSLASGSGGFLTVAVKANIDLVAGAPLTNTASMNCEEGLTETATLTITVGTGANLVLEKSGAPSTVTPGGLIQYTMSYRNIGNQTASRVRITDTIPQDTAYIAGSATASGSLISDLISWNIGDVAAGGGGDVLFQVRVSSLAATGQKISNTGAIMSTDQTKASNTVTTIVSSQSLMLLKMDTPDPVRAGLNIVYTLQVENTGAIALTEVLLIDPIPVGTTFVSADNGGVLSAGNRQVNWTIGSLAVGEKKTFTLTVQTGKELTDGALIENIATATSKEIAPQTVLAVSSVKARTNGTVAFYNASWQPAYGYMNDQTIYLQVEDLDQNVDPTTAETITVVLTNSDSGDRETIIFTETGADTGIFRGSILSTLSATGNESGFLTVSPNSRIEAAYTDLLDDSPVSTASALIDPLGVVFDSVTGTPVAGVVVAIRNWDSATDSCDLTSWPVLPAGQVNPAAPTGSDGKFAFPLVPAGDYCFQVTPPAEYTFPSTVPNVDLPAGFTIGNGSRGEKFTLSVGDPALIRDIPLDPPTGQLNISKTANKTAAAIGDLIVYSVKLENKGNAPVTGITVTDIMPHGIGYFTGSSRIDGASFDDPQAIGGRTFTWSRSSLSPGDSFEITYRAVVGPDSKSGTGTNTVSASGRSLGENVVSNTANFKVKITEGVFTSKGTIIGRVFIDRDGDGLPKKETGIGDVVLYLEDGTRVITDKKGSFSISGVPPGTHVLRLDETSLPIGLIPKPLSNRFMMKGNSQFIDMTSGGLFKANFALDMTAKYRAPENKPATPVGSDAGQAVQPVQEKAGQDKPLTPGINDGSAPKVAGEAGPPPETVSPDSPDNMEEKNPSKETESTPAGPTESTLEEQIMEMTPDLEFISPQDRAVSARRNIRVLIKAPMGTNLILTANGNPVDNKHIGKQIQYAPGRVVVYEFIDIQIRAGEENLIKAEIRDPFGIVRGQKEIRIDAIGEPVRITIAPDQREAAADGTSKIGVTVSLEDKKGHKVTNILAVTVEVSKGDILEKDADPFTEGHQIFCEKGVARFTIIAPRETGKSKIYIQANSLSESADLYFVPYLRQMLITGVGEMVLGHGRSSGELDYLKDRSWFDDGTYADGRGAFFMKGNIYKDFLLTAAYDSDKKRSDELFRESDTRVDSEEKYPIYGDESKVSYEATSRDNLYVKLEKGKSSFLYGDYRTDLTDTNLSAYTRSFNGVKFEANTDRFRLRSFGTKTDQGQFVDTVQGKGISGYYYLTSNTIIEGSERVAIETRDRLQLDRVLSRKTKSRGSDYDIDYDLGTILFKEPISSHDAVGNPIYIVTTYESRQEGLNYYIYGGRGAYKFNEYLELGATGIVEENAISNYQLFGSDMTLNLPGKTTIKAEYANTRGLFDIDSLYVPKTGDGWAFEAKSQPLERLILSGYYRKLSDYFSNLSATDAVRGTRKFGINAEYQLLSDLTLQAEFLDEDDKLNESSHQVASAGVVKKFAKATVGAELTHETSENLTTTPKQTPFTTGGLLNGVPFLNAYETPGRATFANLFVEGELMTDLSLSLSHKQDLGGADLSVSQGGLNYQFSQDSQLYIREEYAKYEDSTQTRTRLGVESQITKNTTAYEEYRLADDSAGYRNQQVMGLENKFQVMEGVTGTLAAEYMSTLNGQDNPNEPDAFAVATGLEYLPGDEFKLTSRVEHRRELVEDGTDSYLAEVAAAYKLNPDYSLLMRERYFFEKNSADENHTSRLMVGLAYRPLENDRFNALSKIEYKYNKRTASYPACSTDSFILSTEGIYQFSRSLQLMAKYAGKLEKEDSFSSYTDLIATRVIFDVTDRFDFGAEYRLHTSHSINTRLHGGALEIGYRVVKQLWLSIGYSFDRFDADLAGDSYQGEGPYLKLRFKFDEKDLNKLNPKSRVGE